MNTVDSIEYTRSKEQNIDRGGLGEELGNVFTNMISDTLNCIKVVVKCLIMMAKITFHYLILVLKFLIIGLRTIILSTETNFPKYFLTAKVVAKNAVDYSQPYIIHGLKLVKNVKCKPLALMTMLGLLIPVMRWCFSSYIGSLTSGQPFSLSPYSTILNTHAASHLMPIALTQFGDSSLNFVGAHKPQSHSLGTRYGTGIYPCQSGIWWKIKTIFYRVYTWMVGLISNIYIPTCALREFIFGLYVWIYQVNLEEYGSCPCQYNTVNSFFTRKLLPGARTICTNSPLVSPCDGIVTSAGLITIDGSDPCELDNFILADIKGIRYKLSTFLGESCRSSVLNDDSSIPLSFLDAPVPKYMAYFILHLSPGDYHHFHMPTRATIREIRHISGEKLPLFDGCPNILTLNERVVALGTWNPSPSATSAKYTSSNTSHSSIDLRFSMTMIGSSGSGHIVLNMDGKEERIVGSDDFQILGKTTIEKGDEFGYFELGSCITILVELSPNQNKYSPVFAIREGDRVQVGQPLLSYTDNMEEQHRSYANI